MVYKDTTGMTNHMMYTAYIESCITTF